MVGQEDRDRELGPGTDRVTLDDLSEDMERGERASSSTTTTTTTTTLKMSSNLSLDDREAAAPSQESEGRIMTTTTTTPSPPPPTRPFQFGQRYLSASDDVFAHNAWDHVVPDAGHEEYAERRYAEQRSRPVSSFDRARVEARPWRWWDVFYAQKSATFFRDRAWLRQEFPILDAVTAAGAGDRVVLEVGAGAGNTAFPILRANRNDRLRLHAVDFSQRAVDTLRACPEYDPTFITAHVWDLASHSHPQTQPQPQPQQQEDDETTTAAGGEQQPPPPQPTTSSSSTSSSSSLPPGLTQDSVDVVLMIFVFSALSPAQWDQAVRNIYRALKPGGQVLFRDYGRGDLAQVRFKAGRWMEENFYLRGDGTRVYFFDKDELAGIWGGGGARGGGARGGAGGGDHPTKETTPRFDILDLDLDRRLIVNRQKRIKMYRCWIQGRFRKPPITGEGEGD